MTAPPPKLTIVPAREASLKEVNALVARSKAYWNWPHEYLSRAIPLHKVTPAYLDHNRCFEIVTNGKELVAFFSVSDSGARVIVDNLWVEPLYIGRGIGRAAMLFIFDLARASRWQHLWVLPDPPAEGFYRALGFSDTGERVPSRVPGGPVFSAYSIAIPHGASEPET